jgi:hypothetical protein
MSIQVWKYLTHRVVHFFDLGPVFTFEFPKFPGNMEGKKSSATQELTESSVLLQEMELFFRLSSYLSTCAVGCTHSFLNNTPRKDAAIV